MMIRDLNYVIWFGDGDEFSLKREMTQIEDPNEGLQETYIIEHNGRSVDFTPEEFAILQIAMREMDRMYVQHRDALTDGAGVQVAEASEASVLHPWSEEMAALKMLADGGKIWPNHIAFADLHEHNLVECEGNPSHGPGYIISDAGHAALAAQAPEANLTAGEADLVSEDDMNVLLDLALGNALLMGHSSLDCFRMRGWVAVTPKTESEPVSEQEYGITDKGRRALAAPTPEAEGAAAECAPRRLSPDERIILWHADVGGRICYHNEPPQVWLFANSRDILSPAAFMRLLHNGWMDVSVRADESEDGFAEYTITDAGRAVLAEQEA